LGQGAVFAVEDLKLVTRILSVMFGFTLLDVSPQLSGEGSFPYSYPLWSLRTYRWRFVEAEAVELPFCTGTGTSLAVFVKEWDTPRNEFLPKAAPWSVLRGFESGWVVASTSRSLFRPDPRVCTF